jgi:hypothetical protein
MMDLVDQANYGTAKDRAREVLAAVDNEVAMAVCRDLTIEKITRDIEKFPLDVQREIVAILTDSMLRKWAGVKA